MLTTRTLSASLAATAIVALTLTGCASGAADAAGTDGSVDAATATSLSAFGELADLEAAAIEEGALNVIALPRDWANYGAVLDLFAPPRSEWEQAEPADAGAARWP